MQAPQTLEQWAHGAKLFDGLGDFHRAITTQSTQAQQYFDQGMRFPWGFNHDEATRSFAEAEHRTQDAIALLRRAADGEDALASMNPGTGSSRCVICSVRYC